MTNKEIFMTVFGKNPENLKRSASTIEWWDQEFIGQPDCEDAISREAALSDEGLAEFHYYEDYAKMRKYLISLPSVQPIRPLGHWINNKNGTYTCDKCGCKHSWSNYCPDCGRRMVEPQERSGEE